LWLLGCINALNLIDGMDGLASMIGLSIAVMVGIIALGTGNPHVSVVALLLAGGLAGFLVYNRPPASIFLGDSGSTMIGLCIGILGIQGSVKTSATLAITAPAVVMTLPMFDVLLAVVRRRLTGRPIELGDRQHIHHRLLDRGLSPWQVLCVIVAFCLATGAAAAAAVALRMDALAWVAATALVALMVRLRLFGNHELRLIRHSLRHGFVGRVLHGRVEAAEKGLGIGDWGLEEPAIGEKGLGIGDWGLEQGIARPPASSCSEGGTSLSAAKGVVSRPLTPFVPQGRATQAYRPHPSSLILPPSAFRLPPSFDLDVGIVYTHERELIGPLVSTLKASAPGLRVRLLLVDNDSAGGVAPWSHVLPDTLVLHNSSRLGYAANLNRILAASAARYVLLLNTDMFFEPRELCLARMTAFMDARPDCGVAGCRLYHADGQEAWAARRFQTLPVLLARRFGLGRLMQGTLDRYLYRDRDPADWFQCEWLSGCFLMLRRAAYQQVGPLDERFGKYFEDVDLCLRMALAGWKVMYHGGTSCYHIEQRGSRRLLSRDGLRHARAYLMWLRKWGPLGSRGKVSRRAVEQVISRPSPFHVHPYGEVAATQEEH
jgi:GT2 family glycosyltransferase